MGLMKSLFILFFIALATQAFGQFRMIGTASWITVNDSTYTATVTFQSDLTGMGYLANQIQVGYRTFTPTEQLYSITAVANATFSSADLTVVELNGNHGSPNGQILVFNPAGNSTIPQAPFGSTGATAQMQAAVDAYNARQVAQSGETNTGSNIGAGVGIFAQKNAATLEFKSLESGSNNVSITGDATTITISDNFLFFTNDAAAAAGGISVGELYKVAVSNPYGLPWGTLKSRTE